MLLLSCLTILTTQESQPRGENESKASSRSLSWNSARNPAQEILAPAHVPQSLSSFSQKTPETWLTSRALLSWLCWQPGWQLENFREAGMVQTSPSELLQESEDEVPQAHPQHLVIVTDDMGWIFLDLDERLGFLQQDDMALGGVFYFDITEAVLLQQKRERRLLGAEKQRLAGRRFQQLRILTMTLPRPGYIEHSRKWHFWHPSI